MQEMQRHKVEARAAQCGKKPARRTVGNIKILLREIIIKQTNKKKM